jgi:cyclopropane fatty-acyl-phospholipid synthase-like methyltransferase
MDHNKETFETWNKIAAIYEDKFMHLDIYNESYDFICQMISKPNALLLELGCGPGNITKYLLSKRQDFQIHGIDIAPNMIELAKKNNPTAHFSIMDVRNIDQLKTRYDGLITGFCIPYISSEECETFIKNAYDLLKPSAYLYLSFVEGSPEKSGFVNGSSGDRTYFFYHDKKAILSQLKMKNFECIKTFTIPYTKSNGEKEDHIICIATKNE